MLIDDEEDFASWIRLERAHDIGPVASHALLSEFGLPSQIFAAGAPAIARVIGEAAATSLLAPPDDGLLALTAQTLGWARQDDHHVLNIADEGYPKHLLSISDPPLLIYVIGNPAALSAPSVAIVGSRNATTPGLANARRFAESLAAAGYAIVSGLALGIDGAAHEGALNAGGSTVAVVGTGADIVYPSRHKSLAARIAKHGAIVSEQPLGMPAIAHNFPRRNRIIAGLARGVVVVEAAAQSGSLITARLAAEQGRDVFAIPGSIHSPLSKGCHQLIKQGAKLVDDARDVLEELAGQGTPMPALETPQVRRTEPMPPWLDAAGFDPFTLDELAARTSASAAALQAAMLDWELDGRIARLPGGRWQRV